MVIYLIILLAVVSRFIPHIPNFAPITALAIFAAAYLPWKKAFCITFATRFISDMFIGFVSWPMMVAIYSGHLVGILFGLWIKRTQNHFWIKIVSSSIFASVIFFLVTNFAFLYSNYPHNWQGILESYVNGLPFLRGTLMGDMFYSIALFGGFEVIKKLAKYRNSHSSYIKIQNN